MIFFPLSVKFVPHYEQEINLSFVIVSLFNLCLVRMGKTLSSPLLVKCCSFSQKCDKKSCKLQNCFFFSSYSVLFTFFLKMSPWKVCRNYLGPKSTFKAAQKITPSQFCSKTALTETNFLKNGNFGMHAIVASFLSCFSCKSNFDAI